MNKQINRIKRELDVQSACVFLSTSLWGLKPSSTRSTFLSTRVTGKVQAV